MLGLFGKGKPSENGLPTLVVSPEKPVAVTGNFQEVESRLVAWKDAMSSVEMTEENMAEVRVVKKEAVAYRNQLQEIQKTVKKVMFNDPKAVFDAQMNRLLTIVGEVESKADEVLSIEEQKRVAEVNLVLDAFKDEFQSQYNLESAFLSRVEYKKSYYNKTADEKSRREDIEQQFKDLQKEQANRHANIKMIEMTIGGDDRLSKDIFIGMLDYSDMETILKRIEDEKARQDAFLANIQKPQEVAQPVQSGIKVQMPLANVVINYASKSTNRKSVNVCIDYPDDLADSMTEVFKQLRRYNVKITKLEEVF